MLHHFFLSALLLTLGALVYRFVVRGKLPALFAKWWIAGVFCLSALMPCLAPSAAPDFDPETYAGWNVVDAQDPELQACYARALGSRDVCRCEVQQKAKLLVYTPNPWYDALLAGSQILYLVLLLALPFWFLSLLWKWGALCRLAWYSPQERRVLDGTVFYMLYPKAELGYPLSAFTLWRHYVIWSPVLERFDAEEQNAVLRHELEHLRQRDTWLRLLWGGLGWFWWLHPAYYALRNEWLRLNELVADQAVVREGYCSERDYARLLIRAKEYQMEKRPAGQDLAFGWQKKQPGGSLLRMRVLHLLDPQARPMASTRRRCYASLLLTGLLFWALSATLSPSIKQASAQLQEYEQLQQKYQNRLL